ncbi:MAG TPA: radical SAM protein [Planctomycetota bacterium]|nr:radical SAM protein [Planctomycetota bacterium]
MKRTLLLVLPAPDESVSARIKYALFPPLGLLTIAGLTPPDRYEMRLIDEFAWSEAAPPEADLVAMTVCASTTARAYRLADDYRRRGARVILGGIHPTALPDEAARHADAVCIGPAEPIWPQVIRDFEAGSLQRFYRADRAGTADLMAMPRRDLINRHRYLVPDTMVATRGCPHACEFCYKTAFWGRRFYECRPAAAVEREVASLPGHCVFMLDDNLLGNRQHAREIFAALRASGKVWQAGASLDAARVPGYLEEAYDSGCRSLFVGFESLSPENLRSANKPVNLATDYTEAIRRFHDAGIMINASFVFGFDHDGPDVFDRTLDFAITNKLETATFHVLTPFPGTRTFDRMQAEGRLLHRDWRFYDAHHAVFRPARLTPEQLEEGQRRAYREFYSCRSIAARSLGMPAALKRALYNIAWKKVDWLWEPVIRWGVLAYARPAFEFVLARNTRPGVGRGEPCVRPDVPADEGTAPVTTRAAARS